MESLDQGSRIPGSNKNRMSQIRVKQKRKEKEEKEREFAPLASSSSTHDSRWIEAEEHEKSSSLAFSFSEIPGNQIVSTEMDETFLSILGSLEQPKPQELFYIEELEMESEECPTQMFFGLPKPPAKPKKPKEEFPEILNEISMEGKETKNGKY